MSCLTTGCTSIHVLIVHWWTEGRNKGVMKKKKNLHYTKFWFFDVIDSFLFKLVLMKHSFKNFNKSYWQTVLRRPFARNVKYFLVVVTMIWVRLRESVITHFHTFVQLSRTCVKPLLSGTSYSSFVYLVTVMQRRKTVVVQWELRFRFTFRRAMWETDRSVCSLNSLFKPNSNISIGIL